MIELIQQKIQELQQLAMQASVRSMQLRNELAQAEATVHRCDGAIATLQQLLKDNSGNV